MLEACCCSMQQAEAKTGAVQEVMFEQEFSSSLPDASPGEREIEESVRKEVAFEAEKKETEAEVNNDLTNFNSLHVESGELIRSFVAEVDLTEAEGHLGLTFDKTNPKRLVIRSVKARGSAVATWNASCHPGQVIKPYQSVIAVNGHAAPPDEMEVRLVHGTNIGLTVQCFEERTAAIQKSSGDLAELGVCMLYRKDSVGVCVKELKATGAIADWNAKNPEQAIAPGDLLLWKGEPHLAANDLADRIQNNTEIQLTVIHYLE
eukprot:TRINITY_DN8346_c0_g1_i2.p1 TRINITY_DN8346_c0_g1~~TRINITY_DN8346_c0_g1_i2.p1  ORF type:complete len:285 (+),score=43.62 TRINITY_DN8346_c0_g1_i2:70-855(+)